MLISRTIGIFKQLPSCLNSKFVKYSISETSNFCFNRFLLSLSNQIVTIQSLLGYHALVITTCNSNNAFIAAKLLSLYSHFNDPTSSTKVFHMVYRKDIFLWNSIIQSHFSNGYYEESLDFYSQMRAFGSVLPDQFTLPIVLTSCAELGLLNFGRNIHGLACKLGLLGGYVAVESSFVHFYSKCGRLNNAHMMFDEIVVRDVVAWTALVIGYVQNDKCEKALELLCEMHRVGEADQRPNFRTVEGGLQACGDLGVLVQGRCLHGFVIKSGNVCFVAVQSSVLTFYSKCGSPEEAHQSFFEIVKKDIISWTSVISVYARFGFVSACLNLFWEMQFDGFSPDAIVICCMITCFRTTASLCGGKAFHGLIIRRNYDASEKVCNALLSMYCKFGTLSSADKLFDSHKCDAESWNSMVLCHSKMERKLKCLELFREMKYLGIRPDSNSLVSVVSSCTQLKATKTGRSVHCSVIKSCIGDDVSVFNALIDMYGKWGNITVAWKIFNSMQRDTISWNTLMSSYIHVRNYKEAFNLFDKLIVEGLKPNTATYIIVLSACTDLASLEQGENVHSYLKETGHELNLPLCTALVDMYAKCGQLEKARELIDSIEEKDIVLWNVMISGYGLHGNAKSAVEVFQKMEKSGVKPNSLTFLALLSACNHAGLVEEGKFLFRKMEKYSLEPNLKHYACMIDLLGRSGNLQEAETLLLSIPIPPDGGIFGALLGACKIHNEIEMGIRIAKYAIKSDPENDGYYVMLSAMYSSSGLWEEAERVREVMKGMCPLGKAAGWSSV